MKEQEKVDVLIIDQNHRLIQGKMSDIINLISS